jgi:hypothetical protein
MFYRGLKQTTKTEVYSTYHFYSFIYTEGKVEDETSGYDSLSTPPPPPPPRVQ